MKTALSKTALCDIHGEVFIQECHGVLGHLEIVEASDGLEVDFCEFPAGVTVFDLQAYMHDNPPPRLETSGDSRDSDSEVDLIEMLWERLNDS